MSKKSHPKANSNEIDEDLIDLLAEAREYDRREAEKKAEESKNQNNPTSLRQLTDDDESELFGGILGFSESDNPPESDEIANVLLDKRNDNFKMKPQERDKVRAKKATNRARQIRKSRKNRKGGKRKTRKRLTRKRKIKRRRKTKRGRKRKRRR